MATNLEFIKSVEVTSSTSSVDIDNVFTDKYNSYYITVTDFQTVSTTQTALYLRYIDSSGSVITGSTYDYAFLQMDSLRAFADIKSISNTQIKFNEIDDAPTGAGFIVYIHNPYDTSSYTFANWQTSSSWTGGSRELRATKGIGVEKTAQSIRGFQLFEVNTRPFDLGKISVYGVKG